MKILIVSPFFEPYIGVGALRMSSFGKFLRKKNEEITVVKLADSEFDAKDIDINFKKSDYNVVSVALGEKQKNSRNYSKVFKRAMANAIANNSYDIILISCGPFYTLPLVKYVKKRCVAKVVVDFRDLWLSWDNQKIGDKQISFNAIKRLFYSIVEKRAIYYSDKVIFVDKGSKEVMCGQYSGLCEKSDVVLNGYENELPNNIISSSNYNIGIMGKFLYYSKESSIELLSAVNHLYEDYPGLRIQHIGADENIKSIIDEYGLKSDIYKYIGQFEYKDAINNFKNNRIGVISYYNSYGYGTKVFDYIMLNIPIIVITPEKCMLSEFVESFENGFWCKNQEEIERTIRYIFDNKITKLCNDKIKLSQYSREIQNDKYHHILSELAD